MAGDRSKLEIQLNKPVTMRVQYDEPQVGEGKYGTWWRWTVVPEGEEEISWFVSSERLANILAMMGLMQGDEITVSKLAKKEGDRDITYFEVKYKDAINNTLTNEIALPNDVQTDDDDVVPAEFVEETSDNHKKDTIPTQQPITIDDKAAKLLTLYRMCLTMADAAQKDILGDRATSETITAAGATLFIQATRMNLL